jgi:hypothetical protein
MEKVEYPSFDILDLPSKAGMEIDHYPLSGLCKRKSPHAFEPNPIRLPDAEPLRSLSINPFDIFTY